MKTNDILNQDLTVQKNILEQMKNLHFSAELIKNQTTIVSNIEKQINELKESEADDLI